MRSLLSLCFVLICTLSFAQVQPWQKAEHSHIPDALKKSNATLVCVKFSDSDIKQLGLHKEYVTEIYNKYVADYSEKYFTGTV